MSVDLAFTYIAPVIQEFNFLKAAYSETSSVIRNVFSLNILLLFPSLLAALVVYYSNVVYPYIFLFMLNILALRGLTLLSSEQSLSINVGVLANILVPIVLPIICFALLARIFANRNCRTLEV
ncbi:hypothetical protein GCM10007894_00750 [Paraferrimonas haliotis]|uniref:Uncharacterized protein n=2 Tax=Paraferrimonas haliotis TaxID=2013866 RepID=A0AA37WV80_9GAMM|nr:hypothetical protein GCM10007894_00750 [Paraferrimonas haliotis]